MKKGFTLVELSIVLIIIGLIIGGVMKGKDLINSAEQKKIYNTWIKGWEVTSNIYRDRTGELLGDGALNGGAVGASDGKLDNVELATTTTVQEKLKAIGLDVPVSNVVGSNGGSYSVKGKYVTSVVPMTLHWGGAAGKEKNRLYMTGLPTDVAIAFDGIANGSLDPQTGAFMASDAATVVWPDAETTTTVDVMLEL